MLVIIILIVLLKKSIIVSLKMLIIYFFESSHNAAPFILSYMVFLLTRIASSDGAARKEGLANIIKIFINLTNQIFIVKFVKCSSYKISILITIIRNSSWFH